MVTSSRVDYKGATAGASSQVFPTFLTPFRKPNLIIDRFSGPGSRISPVCVCVGTITFELKDL